MVNPNIYKIPSEQLEAYDAYYNEVIVDVPTYRYGQGLLNRFPKLYETMKNDGDIGQTQLNILWETMDKQKSLEIIKAYL